MDNVKKTGDALHMLIVDDDFFSRQLLKSTLLPYGNLDIAVNGEETLTAVKVAIEKGEPYDLICLDILMPVMDGQETLKEIRKYEEEKGIHGLDGAKVIMITGVNDNRNVLNAFNTGCEGYLKKPLDEDKLLALLKELGLIE